MKKLYLSKNRERLINIPIGQIYYISAKWRHDKDRKDLAILAKYGYYKRVGRYMYLRIRHISIVVPDRFLDKHR